MTTWQLARAVLRGRRGRVLWVTALSVANGIAQGATVVLLIPLLRVAGVPMEGAGAVAGIDRAVSAVFAAVRLAPTLSVVLVAFVAIAWLQASVERLELVAGTRVEQDVERDLRTSLYAALLAARWAFFTQQRATDLTHAITRDADRAAVAVSYLLRAAGQAVAAAVYLAFALVVSPVATAAALAGGAVLALALHSTFRAAHATGEALTETSTDTLALVTQHVDAIKLVKSFGAERQTLEAFEALADRSAAVAVDATRAHASAHVATAAGSATLLAVVLWIALSWIRVPVAATLVLAFLFWRLLPRLMDVQQSLRDAVHELPGYEAVQRALTACTAAREVSVSASRAGPRAPIAIRDRVEFDDLTFAYDGGPAVLAGVRASVPAGRITAVTGPSGAGKTTLVDLVLGLLHPSSGRILIDGHPLSADRLDAWRDAIAYVPQEPLLFHDTVLANLRWARPAATDAEVARALEQAAADEFVERLPHGLHTVVGDRGVRLSGGERQRLALARALLRQPTLLVLDEATSALDAASEARILSALVALRGSVTTFLVSHRTAPLRHADIVYVLEGGTLRAQLSGAVYP
ncbi:MAG TPA: ABC transporter ATP-binding protein [Gemmatimonadaceae bacterium]|nr:ABC transporter ATP-binding protein [Gemmatimonadaceae bacterium]